MENELLELKIIAHRLGDIIWGRYGKGMMYSWMQYNTSTGHIRTSTRQELEVIIKKMRKMVKSKKYIKLG